MPDLVVTVPKWFWPDWIAEGDAAGDPETGEEWGFGFSSLRRPGIEPGERLYIVAHGRLRGYAPVTRLCGGNGSGWDICRRGGAVAVTIDQEIKGFQGWRRRWWDVSEERAFPDWRTANVPQTVAHA